jgi:DNA-binding NarL/FixJ family response regulator
MKKETSVSSSPASKLRILIVDDIPQVLSDLGFLLDLDPRFEVVGTAENGLEAVRKAEALQPQLILMDLEMPVLDGFAAAREIKSRLPGCALVALSIHSQPVDQERASAAGFDLFIEKGTPLDGALKSFL